MDAICSESMGARRYDIPSLQATMYYYVPLSVLAAIALSIRQQGTNCNYPSDARSLTHSINESINQSCYDVNSYLATVDGSIEKKKSIQSSMWKTLEILEIYMPCLILQSKV